MMMGVNASSSCALYTESEPFVAADVGIVRVCCDRSVSLYN
jgi:hypothetical protein